MVNKYLDNNKVLIIAAIFWAVVGNMYLKHTPFDHRSHDFNGHFYNTTILINQNRLYKPYELAVPGGETFQQPLYYLIASLFERDSFNSNRIKHINAIRYLSLLYGVIALIFIGKTLNLISSNHFGKTLVLLLISSTPKFAFVFSTYNNDSITTMFGIIVIHYFFKLLEKWDKKDSYLLLTSTIGFLYSKLSALLCLGAIVFSCIKNLFSLKSISSTNQKILKIIFCSILTIIPWFIFNGYFSTGDFSAKKADLHRPIAIENFIAVPGILFRISGLLSNHPDYSHEWDKPWILPVWDYIPRETKRYDYFGFIFITSIIGEYVLSSPPENVIWDLLIVHFIICLASLFFAFKSKEKYLKLFLTIMIVTVTEQVVLLIPFLPKDPNHGYMDYRYIAWLWIIWGVFQLNCIDSSKKLKDLFYGLFIVGILLNVYVLKHIEGGYWW